MAQNGHCFCPQVWEFPQSTTTPAGTWRTSHWSHQGKMFWRVFFRGSGSLTAISQPVSFPLLQLSPSSSSGGFSSCGCFWGWQTDLFSTIATGFTIVATVGELLGRTTGVIITSPRKTKIGTKIGRQPTQQAKATNCEGGESDGPATPTDRFN